MFETLRVDHDKQVIFGAVVAEVGEFRSGRGQFDDESLRQIVRLMNAMPSGCPCHRHHQQPGSDQFGTFLGRLRNARVDGRRVRADLHLDPSAFATPHGDLGNYLLKLAKSDPTALALSLVLAADKIPQRGGAPIWRPIEVQGADIVAFGDATPNGLLPLSAAPADRLFYRETQPVQALAFVPRP